MNWITFSWEMYNLHKFSEYKYRKKKEQIVKGKQYFHFYDRILLVCYFQPICTACVCVCDAVTGGSVLHPSWLIRFWIFLSMHFMTTSRRIMSVENRNEEVMRRKTIWVMKFSILVLAWHRTEDFYRCRSHLLLSFESNCQCHWICYLPRPAPAALLQLLLLIIAIILSFYFIHSN